MPRYSFTGYRDKSRYVDIAKAAEALTLVLAEAFTSSSRIEGYDSRSSLYGMENRCIYNMIKINAQDWNALKKVGSSLISYVTFHIHSTEEADL